MEAFGTYLIKSVIWLSGFALVFLLFLKNERFFVLNRIYLIAGIFTSFLFPLISIHYTVVMPLTENISNDFVVSEGVLNVKHSIIPDTGQILLIVYSIGALTVAALLIKQSSAVIRTIKRSVIIKYHPVKLIRTADQSSSFSFFSYVFVNPSITDLETEEIMNHEIVHIQQKHWFDLVLVELLCVFQWFNPLVWIYVRFMRQNHEYLADEVALQRTSNPANYRAALLNQIVGSNVVSLANSFNYSLNKKRFNMMKNIMSSPYRKLKILFILPVFAIVLYSFAKPEYQYVAMNQNNGNKNPATKALVKEVKGKVVQEDGKPLEGASVVVVGTTTGTITDSKGLFTLSQVPEDASLAISYVGFESKVIKPDFTSEMTFKLPRRTVVTGPVDINLLPPPPPPLPPPPPPPPSPQQQIPPLPLPTSARFNIRSADGKAPLVVIDGVISDANLNKISPDSIESLSVLKSNSNTEKYGERGKDGVIEITTRKGSKTTTKDTISVIGYRLSSTPPPTPPPSARINIRSVDGKAPLLVIDGVISEGGLSGINYESIESIDVLKDSPATERYGEKGKNGVIIITSKKVPQSSKLKEITVVGYGISPTRPEASIKSAGTTDPEKKITLIEEMPMFPGGENAMREWIARNMKYPPEAFKNKIEGRVYVNFIVTSTGEIINVKVKSSPKPFLDAEAIRVVKRMPKWKPGTQNGKPIDVEYSVPMIFKPK